MQLCGLKASCGHAAPSLRSVELCIALHVAVHLCALHRVMHSMYGRMCILVGGFGVLYTAMWLKGLEWPRGTRPWVAVSSKWRTARCLLFTQDATVQVVRDGSHLSLNRAAAQVTLVDKSDRFVFKPLLYELINGAAKLEEVAPRYSQLLQPYATSFVQVLSTCCYKFCYLCL